MVPVTTKREIRASHKPERQVKAERGEAQVPVSTAEVVATPARRYLLQVGSFRSLEDADRLRVKLLLTLRALPLITVCPSDT
jgi:cell division protein FtsN